MDYGTITHKGQELQLTEQAYLSNRVFPGWWGDVAEGEPYTAEYQAGVVDTAGDYYLVRWQFATTKGSEPEDESSYGFANADITAVINL